MADFAKIQQRFLSKILSGGNPSKVTIQLLKTTSTGSFTDFTGDSTRSVDKEVILNCFYQRYLNDKQREKGGVGELVTMSIFISPLELERKYGTFDFPDYVRNSYSKIAIQFLGKHLEIESIRDLEPQQVFGKVTCVAYQINIKGDTGNTDFN